MDRWVHHRRIPSRHSFSFPPFLKSTVRKQKYELTNASATNHTAIFCILTFRPTLRRSQIFILDHRWKLKKKQTLQVLFGKLKCPFSGEVSSPDEWGRREELYLSQVTSSVQHHGQCWSLSVQCETSWFFTKTSLQSLNGVVWPKLISNKILTLICFSQNSKKLFFPSELWV